MYDYREYAMLNLKNVLSRVTHEEIFEMAIGYRPVEYVRVVSPLRKDDTTPGCFFTKYDGKLWFVDFADKVKHRDSLNMVQDMFGVSFMDALRMINSHFNLGLGTSLSIPEKYEVKTRDIPSLEKKVMPIIFKPRDFDQRDAEFWSQYGISRENLIEDGVFPVIWYKVYSQRLRDYVVIRPNTVSYAYTDFSDGRVKIYTPHRGKVGKWVTNCTEDDIGGINSLPDFGDLLIISKSYKDFRVLRNMGFNSVWFQNEGMIPNMEIINDLCSRFNRIIVWFDNDSSGITNAIKVSSFINGICADKSQPFHLPVKLLKQKITDPSDFLAVKGESEFKKLLYKEQLLQVNNSQIF